MGMGMASSDIRKVVVAIRFKQTDRQTDRQTSSSSIIIIVITPHMHAY
jgi:hypothetical protein